MTWKIPEQDRLDRLAELECTVKRFDEAIHALSFNASHNIGDESVTRADLPTLYAERTKAIREMKQLNALDPNQANFPDGARTPGVAYNRFRHG